MLCNSYHASLLVCGNFHASFDIYSRYSQFYKFPTFQYLPPITQQTVSDLIHGMEGFCVYRNIDKTWVVYTDNSVYTYSARLNCGQKKITFIVITSLLPTLMQCDQKMDLGTRMRHLWQWESNVTVDPHKALLVLNICTASCLHDCIATQVQFCPICSSTTILLSLTYIPIISLFYPLYVFIYTWLNVSDDIEIPVPTPLCMKPCYAFGIVIYSQARKGPCV